MPALSKKFLALTVVALLGVAGCSSGEDSASGDELIIATTDFSETKIIASMYQQVLEANGIPATIKELTTREVIAPALADGEVEVTPEYLGSLTEYLNKQANGPDAPQIATGDVQETFAAASELALAQGVTLLEPSAAQDQNAFAVTSEFAQANSLVTLSELGTYSQGSPIALGGPAECPERPFCQIGLESVYGVQVGSFTPYGSEGLRITALTQGDINVALVFSSSGAVAANDLVVLADDKALQPADNILPAVHTASLTDEIAAALDSVSAVLTTDALQEMNAQVDVQRMDPDDVATEFLQANNLL